MKSQRVQKKRQEEKASFENRKKFGGLETTRFQKIQDNGKTEKSKGRFLNNGSKCLISRGQQEQEAQGTEEKEGNNRRERDEKEGQGWTSTRDCRGEKNCLLGLTTQSRAARSLLSNIRF